MWKDCKTMHHNFPEPRMTSKNVLLCLTNSPELKDIQFTMIMTKNSNKSSHFEMLGIFSLLLLVKLLKGLIDYENSCWFFFCRSANHFISICKPSPSQASYEDSLIRASLPANFIWWNGYGDETGKIMPKKTTEDVISQSRTERADVNVDVEWHSPLFYVLLQFDKPGARDNYDYPDMAKEAGAYLNRIWTLFSRSKDSISLYLYIWEIDHKVFDISWHFIF